jgi:tRNA nucleotidyltransferase (CCA-adding enzyme)
MQFVARFELQPHPTTLQLCQEMVHNKLLVELPKERIYKEFTKLLLKAHKPSLCLLLLKKLGALNYFKPLRVLSQKEYFSVCNSLDTLQTLQTPNPQTHLFIAFALLCRFFNTQECIIFLTLLSDEKRLHKEVCHYLMVDFDLCNITPYALYKLAQHRSIQNYLLFLQAQGALTQAQKNKIKRWSLKLGIYTQAKKPLISGKDLLQAGLKPSKEFSHILQELYEKQIKGEFHTTQEGIDLLIKG